MVWAGGFASYRFALELDSCRFVLRGRRPARAFASLHLTSGISLLIMLAAWRKSFWWRLMCCMIRRTPFTSEERLRIETVIWERQKGQTNRKGFGPAKGLLDRRVLVFYSFSLLGLGRRRYK